MVRRFAGEERGAVAIVFALALLPLFGLVGAAIDYSRATQARADLQAAVDAAALAAARGVLDQTKQSTKRTARKVFNAGFRRTDGTVLDKFDVTQTTGTLTLDVKARVPLTFGAFVGVGTLEVAASAQVPLGTAALEVMLVLDNTGSMARLGKIDALKESAKNLIDTLQAASGSFSNIKLGIVPFNTQVNVGSGNRYASWLRFSPGGAEPKLDVTQAAWQGCVADRDQPQDTRDTLPSTGQPKTLYPAANCQFPGLLQVTPLSSNFSALKTTIDAMVPTGNTNTGIGLAWGLAQLTNGAPLSTAATPNQYLQKTIVFLTDGLNTENRWTNDPAQMDPRTTEVCTRIKANKITLYTIRVIEGNETLLRDCASDPSMYYSVMQASELKGVFDKIAAELVTLRLSH